MYTEEAIRIPCSIKPRYEVDVYVVLKRGPIYTHISIVSKRKRWRIRCAFLEKAENVSIYPAGEDLYLQWQHKKVCYEIKLKKRKSGYYAISVPAPLLESLGLVQSLRTAAA